MTDKQTPPALPVIGEKELAKICNEKPIERCREHLCDLCGAETQAAKDSVAYDSLQAENKKLTLAATKLSLEMSKAILLANTRKHLLDEFEGKALELAFAIQTANKKNTELQQQASADSKIVAEKEAEIARLKGENEKLANDYLNIRNKNAALEEVYQAEEDEITRLELKVEDMELKTASLTEQLKTAQQDTMKEIAVWIEGQSISMPPLLQDIVEHLKTGTTNRFLNLEEKNDD